MSWYGAFRGGGMDRQGVEYIDTQRGNGTAASERSLMLAYWGVQGALPKITLDLARVATAQHEITCTFAISNSNELFKQYAFLRDDLFAVDTFKNKTRSFFCILEILNLRRYLKRRFISDNTRAYVSLMSHIWSPLLAPVIRRVGVKHVVVVHDVDRHPGDRTAWINWWLLREARRADRVITLSKSVARRLAAVHGIPEKKISVLFHPDLNYGCTYGSDVNEHGPLRVLFIGRILPYKGLSLLVDAVEGLRREGVALELGVFGRGKITSSVDRKLAALGAEVVNRWLTHDEIGSILSRYDIVVAAHTEASQSGVIAAAFGAGLPVVAMPVGGLIEQITPDVTGVIADSSTTPALAAAIRKVAENRAFLAQLRQGIAATREERSVERFFGKVCEIALGEAK